MTNRKEILRLTSQQWTSLSNPSSLIHLILSVTQRIRYIQKQATFALKITRDNAELVRGQLASYVVALVVSQFRVHIFLCSCVRKVREVIVSIGMALSLPSALTISKIPTSSLSSFGVLVILIVASGLRHYRLTTDPGRRYSTNSALLKKLFTTQCSL
jgi:hypothetical protein